MWSKCKGLPKKTLTALFTIQAIVILNYIYQNSQPKLQKTVLPTGVPYAEEHHVIQSRNITNVSVDADSLSPWPPKGYTRLHMYPFLRKSFTMSNGSTEGFFEMVENITCLVYGTRDRDKKDHRCICKEGWYGSSCSIPESVQSSGTYGSSRSHTKITRKPRRIINAFTFNREWGMLEARMNELGSLVDLFIVLESNYTLHGDPKELKLLKRLQNGYLKEFHPKIMYVFQDHFPKGGREDGWLAEGYTRNYLVKAGLRKVQGTLPRDLFMFTDADEVPSFESILFLKLHEGYSEPVGFMYNWACYGFFWPRTKLFKTTAVSSLDFFSEIANNDVQWIRGQKYKGHVKAEKLRRWGQAWHIGSEKAKGGWHCSWCLPVEDIQNKLVSAINADFPRWGDYPEKIKLPYIQSIVQKGIWFDDKPLSVRKVTYKTDPSIVPRYFIENQEHYRYLLDIKYVGS